MNTPSQKIKPRRIGVEAKHEAYLERIKASLAAIKAGHVTRFKSVQALMNTLIRKG